MKHCHYLAPLVLLLAACGGPSEDPTPEPVAETTTEVTTEATTPEATTDPVDRVAQCETSQPQGPIGEAIAAVELPEGTRVAQVEEFPPLPDAEDQNSTYVEVELCSVPLNSDEHRAVATDVAAAAATAEGPGIYRMQVELWMPRDDGSLREGRVLYVEEFGSFTWDRERVPAIDSMWQERT